MLLGSSVVTMICFAVIGVSTIFLGISVKLRGKWVQRFNLPNQTLERNRRMLGTVAGVSSIYIIYFLPGILVILVHFTMPALNAFTPHTENLSIIMATFIRNFQALSGMLNIFVYATMNVKYNQFFFKLLSLECARNRLQCFSD